MKLRDWLVVAAAWLVPAVAVTLLIVTIFDVPGLKTQADRSADRQEILTQVAVENRLLFKWSCALPLAVAERLDRLIVAALENPTLTEGQRFIYREYHKDFIRGKDICPPLTRQDQEQVAQLIRELGGRVPRQR